MKVEKRQKKRSGRNSSEIGAIRVFSNPGPDAEARLHRLFSLLVRYATSDAQAEFKKDSVPDARHEGEHSEAEA